MALSQGRTPLFDTMKTKKVIINDLGATRTLSVDETGSTVVFNRAAGIVVTLPLAVPGLHYEFVTSTSVTSNAYKVITGAATEILIGGILSNDSDTGGAVVAFDSNGSTHIAVSMNGTTTGGLIGTRIRFTCLSTTRWIVEGVNVGSGTVATPFATS